ncbi:hypothetical protein KP509_32G003300 [Ceratopteris richardii]|uniref:Diacylglycerol kinase n=1 Tax=Ceratopteris richardii TaxID=49495 RepID=A0A8T2QQX1_CERRI|nr:hypothetical protein KP509_32G003300 [Ceratopteris richardii]
MMVTEKYPEFLQEMKIPDYIMKGGPIDSIMANDVGVPCCPVLTFVNSKSGGQLGAKLLDSYQTILSPSQVFDLSKVNPEQVLQVFYKKLEKLKSRGDKIAESIQNSLRIIVAGGDGTAGWLLWVIGELKLSCPPAIAMVPLGTGNNLPFLFGWGKKNPHTDLESSKNFLYEVYKAKPMNIDSWHVSLKMANPSKSLEPVILPHSLHSSKKVAEPDTLQEVDTQVYRGGFWNYLSIGMDAQVSFEFHQIRQKHPQNFKNQLRNQVRYATIGITQGWFLTNIIHPYSRNIQQLGDIYVQRCNVPLWEKLKISKSIRSIVMLNLPSFSGGLNPWGTPSSRKSAERQLTPAYVNDGLIEIVGFRDGWHGLALLTPKGHGTRLAQAHKVRIQLRKGGASHIYMRMDGEPWMQPLPEDDHSVTTFEITNAGQAAVLKTSRCNCRSVPPSDDTESVDL